MATYFIVDEIAGLVKIGKATDPEKRLRALQTGNGRPLRIALVLPVGWEFLSGGNCPEGGFAEKAMHLVFKNQWIRGEWFLLKGPVQKFIDDMYSEGA
jgi:hypothetical protein